MICLLHGSKVEQETAESMQTLLKLDVIKARMKAASDALRVSTHQLHSNSRSSSATLRKSCKVNGVLQFAANLTTTGTHPAFSPLPPAKLVLALSTPEGCKAELI